MLKDFAPGAQLPVLLYNGDSKTDTVTIEDFLEDRLGPPRSVASAALRERARGQRGARQAGGAAGRQHTSLPALPPSSAMPTSLQVPQPGPAVQGVESGWERHLPQVLHFHQESSACPG